VSRLIRANPKLSYYLLAYALTWVIAVPLLLSARGWMALQIPHELEGLAAFGPMAAAIIVTRISAGTNGLRALLASCVNWRVPPAWLAFVMLSPFVVLAIAAVLTPARDPAEPAQGLQGFILSAAFIELVVFGGLFQGVGEEPGWRGFAIPRLRRYCGPLLATLMLFPVWLCWHLPMFLSRPEFTFGSWLGFSLGILSAAIWLTLIYDATRSALMAIVWHMLINVARGLAMALSLSTFLLFGQVVAGVALLIVVYWLIVRPGRMADS
jgi:membrane protease YdiL (CAAX protease family)